MVCQLRDELARSAVAQSNNALTSSSREDLEERYPHPLSDRELRSFLEYCTENLIREPNVIDISLDVSSELEAVEKGDAEHSKKNRVYVVGDIHGQFFDLCSLLDKINSMGEGDCIVFTGDFVDRGSWGLEVILLILALHIRSANTKSRAGTFTKHMELRKTEGTKRRGSFSSFSAQGKPVLRASGRSSTVKIIPPHSSEGDEDWDTAIVRPSPITTPTDAEPPADSTSKLGSSSLRKHSNPEEFLGFSLDGSEGAHTADEIVSSYGIWTLPRVIILRGNHETGSVAALYGFFDEVRDKYGAGYVQLFRRLFAALPLAAIVRCGTDLGALSSFSSTTPHLTSSSTSSASSPSPSRSPSPTLSPNPSASPSVPSKNRAKLSYGVLLVHGGLWRCAGDGSSKELNAGLLKELRGVRRQGYEDPPRVSIVSDLLWSDPGPDDIGIKLNTDRGSGLVFGGDTLRDFLKQHRLTVLMRSHEGPNLRARRKDMPQELSAEGHSSDICWEDGTPACVTVFSAPDYPQFQRGRGNTEGKRTGNAASFAILKPQPLGTPEPGKAIKIKWNIEYVKVEPAPRPKGVKYCKI